MSGELISPARAAGSGLPPYRQLGYGDVRFDWEWCPIWFSAFSKATIAGETPYVFVSRAHRYRERGELSALVPPPWTASLIELLDFYDRLEVEREIIEQRERKNIAERTRASGQSRY